MAVLVCCGFERGTHLGLATGNANNKYLDRTQGTLGTNVEIIAAAARTGSYGLRLTASAATVFCGFANNANGGVLSTSAIIVQSFWFRIPSLPGANAIVWSSFGTVGGADMALRFVQSTGTLNAEVGASTITGPTVSANTWYHVDLKADYGVNPHTLDWRFNEIAQTQVTAAQAAEQIFNAGWGLDNAAQTITFHVDDTLMSITAADYPFGKHKVVQLIPDTGGAAVEIGTADATRRFTTNSTADGSFNSADILTAISEVPPLIGSTATGVCQFTSGTGNAVGIPMTSFTLAGGETVGGLRIVVVGWAATTTAAAIGLRTFNGTTETTLFSSADPNFDASTTAPAGLCKMATLANFDTQSELDALVVRLGYSADVSPIIGAHAIYAELAVKEVAGVTATLDLATETDSTFTTSATKTGTVSLSSETDTGLASGFIKTVVLGLATETNETFTATFGVTQVVTLGLAAEINTAQSLAASKITVQSLATETDSTATATFIKTVILGLATESDAPFAVTTTESASFTLDIATETSTAQQLTVARAVALALAEEADASATATLVKLLSLGLANETDTAFAIESGDPDGTATSAIGSGPTSTGVIASTSTAAATTGSSPAASTGAMPVPTATGA